MDRLLIIPAAGLGSRLGGALPKLLVPVNGRAMIDHVLALYSSVAQGAAVIVHPAARTAVAEHLRGGGGHVELFEQARPTGMLDAILLAKPAVERWRPRRVLITWCDQIGIHPHTVARLVELTAPPRDPAVAMPTSRRSDPYIHLQRSHDGRIARVLHRREGDPMPAVGESDAGVFDLSLAAYLEWLPLYERSVEVGGTTGERNFLPFLRWAAERGEVETFPCVEPEEAIGINTPRELAIVEAYLRARPVDVP